MSLLTEWREHAYSLDDRTPEGKEFWLDYFQREKAIYEKILENPQVIKTPVVRNGKKSTLGYQPDVWKRWDQNVQTGRIIDRTTLDSYAKEDSSVF